VPSVVPARPGTIVGVGLNYLPHAADLAARPTELPTLFFKGGHTVIGHGDPIPLPPMSRRVTAEAELGLVIGRRMYQATAAEALGYVAGGCCVLDQTAEDVLKLDARMLTLAKNFPGFFSLGPELIPLADLGPLPEVQVSTCLNGNRVRTASVAEMRFSPADLLAFISQVMPLEPGDVVSTGTPGAVVLAPGDTAECRITGFQPLTNPVVRAARLSAWTAQDGRDGTGEYNGQKWHTGS
jgi:2-keto-4-pentenoate hydratase/2-oxohepta-3-ene-1,7-dioic acid hydratase in catechol pathway